MAAAYVQTTHGDWASGLSWNTSITATNGNCLVVVVQCYIGLSNTVITVSDGVNTYTVAGVIESAAFGVWQAQKIYVAKNITGGSLTLTTTLDNNNSAVEARTSMIEISGASTTAPQDQYTAQYQATPGAGTDVISSGSVSTTVNGEVIIGATMGDLGDTITVGTGFTDTGSTYGRNGLEYLLQSSSGSIAATFNGSFQNITSYRTSIVTIQPSGGGGGSVIVDPFGAAGVFGA